MNQIKEPSKELDRVIIFYEKFREKVMMRGTWNKKVQDHIIRIPGLKATCRVVALFGIMFFFCLMNRPAVIAADFSINCDAHKGVCVQSLGDLTVSLEIAPRPVKAMQDLIFKVSITGPPLAKIPYIDLGMPAMKMGPNRVLLKRVRPGYFEGKGVIVKCPSGRRTWFANVTIPETGEVKFIFDVIY
jgi:hypothetical protein